ncbi:MAG: hypothetical protein J4N64_04320 [Chloroflexi bacterium]|nr:hypothetical protein [Chloroflexota bacterium]MCI0840975.1 hypothetical protein [Chloroflexota bacterium]
MQVDLRRGVFTISIDTELAWGSIHHPDPETYRDYSQERQVVDSLLKLFEKYQIAATWATVGHLFLNECHLDSGGKHKEVMRPRYPWFDGDWFDADPCTDVSTSPLWYGQDIVQKIQACSVPQEIGSHSFAHFIIGSPQMTPECFESDLSQCRLVASDMGVDLKSFVYPRNSLGHVEVLAKNGFLTYRGRMPGQFENTGTVRRRIMRLADKLAPRGATVVRPEKVCGIWNIPQTYFFSPSTGKSRKLPISFLTYLAGRRINQAVRFKGLFHMWFHPHDITADPERSLQGLENILSRVDKLRAANLIDNLTMGDLGETLSQEN